MLVGPGFWMKVRPLTISKVSPFNAPRVARPHRLQRILRRGQPIWSSAIYLLQCEPYLPPLEVWFTFVDEGLGSFFMISSLSTMNVMRGFHV